MNWTELRQLIARHFNLEEIRTLCFDLELDYESLGGEGKDDKVRELVLWSRRHNHLERLQSALEKSRPFVSWPDLTSISGADEEDRADMTGEQTDRKATKSSGTSYSVTIGDVGSGSQIAVGENISQASAGGGTGTVELYSELSAAIMTLPKKKERHLALEQLDSLKAEAATSEPDLEQLELAKQYFLELGGQVTEAVEKLFQSEPMQQILVKAAEAAVRAKIERLTRKS